jgi:hypothetical protein
MESCSSYFLPRLVGHSNASYLVSTGGVFPPTSKHFGDLFNEILPDPSKVLPRAIELATEIAENVSPSASYLNRALMWRDTGSAEAAHIVESHVIHHMFAAPYVIPFLEDERLAWALLTFDIATRKRVFLLSLRRGSQISGLILMITRRLMFLGGPRLILVGIPKLRLPSFRWFKLCSKQIKNLLGIVSDIIHAPAIEVDFWALLNAYKSQKR